MKKAAEKTFSILISSMMLFAGGLKANAASEGMITVKGTLSGANPGTVSAVNWTIYENEDFSSNGFSYDADSGTITLSNFNNPKVEIEFDSLSDLNIDLIGTNAISSLTAMESGAIRFSGTGSMTVNENRNAVNAVYAYGSGQIRIGADVSFTAYKGKGQSGYPGLVAQFEYSLAGQEPIAGDGNLLTPFVYDETSGSGQYMLMMQGMVRKGSTKTGTAVISRETGELMARIDYNGFSEFYRLAEVGGTYFSAGIADTAYGSSMDEVLSKYEPAEPAAQVTFEETYLNEYEYFYGMKKNGTGEIYFLGNDLADANHNGNREEDIMYEKNGECMIDGRPYGVFEPRLDVCDPVQDGMSPEGFEWAYDEEHCTYTLTNDKIQFVPFADEGSFTDVAESSPYYDAIYWAAGSGITTGKTATTFAPDAGCTRAQFVTFLWRMQGKPEPAKTAGFADMVSSTSPFYKAISWAVEQGITSGYADNTFRPNDTCSRGAAVTFLYRAAKEPELETVNVSFSDMVSSDHAYYKGIVWAVTNKVTDGYKDGTFKPFRTCSRGQNVTFLYRAKSMLG